MPKSGFLAGSFKQNMPFQMYSCKMKYVQLKYRISVS